MEYFCRKLQIYATKVGFCAQLHKSNNKKVVKRESFAHLRLQFLHRLHRPPRRDAHESPHSKYSDSLLHLLLDLDGVKIESIE